MNEELLEIVRDLSILCVEDEKGVRKRLVNTLRFYFKNVYEADNGIEGYKIYESEDIDIIISDIDMPKSNGIELIKRVRKKDRDTPIIVLTAYSNEEYLMELINLHVNHFILKPANSTKLLEALENSLKSKKPDKIIKLNDDLLIDLSALEIRYRDGKIKITNRERLFLELLYKNKTVVSTYSQIEEYVWQNDNMSSSALKTFVKVLRKKLPYEMIENISGVGYRFCNI